MPKPQPEPEGDFLREDIVSNPRETSYAVWLSESDVVALKAGVVTPYLQQYAVRLLAMVEPDEHEDSCAKTQTAVVSPSSRTA